MSEEDARALQVQMSKVGAAARDGPISRPHMPPLAGCTVCNDLDPYPS
jgi:hypothetical protein